MNRLIPILLVLISIACFITTLRTTHTKIGRPFPGYLTFENGVVGAFYLPDWPGPKRGITYHKTATEGFNAVFSKRDFLFTAALPAASGILFVLLGILICLPLVGGTGYFPLLFFHFLVGNYIVLTPDFHLTYNFTYIFLALFIFIPATMMHLALIFPERAGIVERHPALNALPYIISSLLLVPYIWFFKKPDVWIVVEYVMVFYVIATYLFWLTTLFMTLKRPHLEFNRIIARYILLGQIIAFVIPLLVAVWIFAGGFSFPLNFVTPLTLLFPVALFVGVLLGRLKQSQMQLVQTEKMATLGNLLGGLAHELKNPMTFIYSNIEPLREMVADFRRGDACVAPTLNDLESIINNLEEGATRSKEIIDNFQSYFYKGRGEKQATQLDELIGQSLVLLSPKWKGRIEVEKRFGEIPMVQCSPVEIGQVFLNLISNACDAIKEKGKIGIETRMARENIEIRIKDNGHGIPRGELSQIFDPFYTTKPPGEGTGLGLAIASRIIKNHKGTIEVRSEVGKGTEFILTLPI